MSTRRISSTPSPSLLRHSIHPITLSAAAQLHSTRLYTGCHAKVHLGPSNVDVDDGAQSPTMSSGTASAVSTLRRAQQGLPYPVYPPSLLSNLCPTKLSTKSCPPAFRIL